MTEASNAEIARRVERFWHAQGYDRVHVWPDDDGVKSNLIGGLPPMDRLLRPVEHDHNGGERA